MRYKHQEALLCHLCDISKFSAWLPYACMHLLALLCSLPALNKTMYPCKSASSGSISVAKESSSDALACVR